MSDTVTIELGPPVPCAVCRRRMVLAASLPCLGCAQVAAAIVRDLAARPPVVLVRDRWICGACGRESAAVPQTADAPTPLPIEHAPTCVHRRATEATTP